MFQMYHTSYRSLNFKYSPILGFFSSMLLHHLEDDIVTLIGMKRAKFRDDLLSITLLFEILLIVKP